MKKVKILSKNFILYCIIYTLILIILIVFFTNIFNLETKDLVDNTTIRVYLRILKIFLNNEKNLLSYTFCCIFYPIMILLELLNMSFYISISISNNGLIYTMRKLINHGIIEYPNILLYTYLSLNLFKKIVKDKKFRFSLIRDYIISNKKLYIICQMLLIIASIIEGIMV